MSVTPTLHVPERLRDVFTLARLLQAMEGSAGSDANQYRQVAQRLSEVLQGSEPDEALTALLQVFPSAGLVYENGRYAQAGLCLHPLDESTSSEIQTRELLSRLQRKTPER